MVKWLFEQLDLKDNDGRKPYNNDIDIEWVFCIMCSNGYLHMAQWLLQQKPHINHRICDDHAFRLACARGYLHVAQWLWDLVPSNRPNIHTHHDFAIK